MTIRDIEDAWVPDVLDAAALALDNLASDERKAAGPYAPPEPLDIAGILEAGNDVLLEGRVAFAFVDGRLRERAVQPMHVALIEPFEHVLTSDARFQMAEDAYLEASGQLATGYYGASITSAGSALQAAFQALGAKGNDLGALFSDAKRRGFLLGHDTKLLDALKSIGSWVTADRSNRGNAHGPATATRADAQLALHIVAATIIRLTSF